MIKANNPKLYWRCRPDNIINSFYFNNSDGCYKTADWNIFWYGIDDFQQIEKCVEFAAIKQATLS
jgi:acetylglutamate synthase